jgi:hypothetical protein
MNVFLSLCFQRRVEGQPAHRGGGVELLGYRHKRDACASKTSTIFAKSAGDRVSRSTLYRTTTSIRPWRMSSSSPPRRDVRKFA